MTFTPTISYTVPADWGNYEDLPGNFLLIPPEGNLDGVNAGTSDYLGIYTSVAAEAVECNAQPAPGVAQTAAGIAHALATRPGITATTATTVTVGGLKGLVLDLKLKKGWTHSACSGTSPDVAMLLGMAPSDFEAAIGGTHDNRIYLLDNGDHVTGIVIDDPSGGGNLKAFDPVVKSLQFGPA